MKKDTEMTSISLPYFQFSTFFVQRITALDVIDVLVLWQGK